jgi:hypothetical protein
MHHFDLLNHPDVYAQLKGWITRDPVRGARGTVMHRARPNAHPA